MKLALLGEKLTHSMSPFIHNELFLLAGINGEYDNIEIKDKDFNSVLKITENLDGFNVTIPYKQKIIPYLDCLSDEARVFGSVNTVKRENVKLTGYNTDIDGIKKTLEILNIKNNGDVLIAGCGGSAAVIASFFAKENRGIILLVREKSMDKANILAENIKNNHKNANIKICTKEPDKNFSLLINATPVGMYPNTGNSPVSEKQIINCDAVFDLIYNPFETKFIKIAKKSGIKTINGMPMLVWQAAKAAEIWYDYIFSNEQIDDLIAKTNMHLEKVFT